MNDAKPPFDVALSFLMHDMETARRLYEKLSETLSVFFFERKQEELTGRDGLEGFRVPFLEARVSVVLYRFPWGEANWTSVERIAIGEECQKRGYRNLFMVSMDSTQKMPEWVPTTHIYFNIEQFPFEELVGAIKLKVIELGGRIQPMTAEKRAEIHVAQKQFQKDRQRFRTTSEGTTAMQREIITTFQEINRKCTEFSARGIVIRSGSGPMHCVITNDVVSLVIRWARSGYPGVERDELRVDEYDINIALPNEQRLIYFDGDPRPTNTSGYELELTMVRENLWKPSNGDSLISSVSLADKLVIQFFELADHVTAQRNRSQY